MTTVREEIERLKRLSEYDLIMYFREAYVNALHINFMNDYIYKYLRNYIVQNDEYKEYIPEIVKDNRSLDEFYNYMKNISVFLDKKQKIYIQFRPLLDYVEFKKKTIIENKIQFDEKYIQDEWSKAIERKDSDPEAAITSSRTLLENILRLILDERNVEYDVTGDLQLLFKDVKKELAFAPEPTQEKIFNQTLSGMNNAIHGLGSIRNVLGDSHGKGKDHIKPDFRHSELAVNLAGAMAMFLYRTHKETKEIE